MYKVDNREILSVRLIGSELQDKPIHIKDNRSLLSKIFTKKDRFITDDNIDYLNKQTKKLVFIEGEFYNKPSVTVKFINTAQSSDYFEFDTDEEALEFFNKITNPNHSIK